MRAYRHTNPEIGPSFDSIERDLAHVHRIAMISPTEEAQIRKHFAYAECKPRPVRRFSLVWSNWQDEDEDPDDLDHPGHPINFGD